MIKLKPDYFEHPILQPFGLRIKTKAIENLEETLTRWLWLGATGGCILGDSRVGKTTALEFIASKIKTRANRTIPCHIFSVPKRDIPTITSIYRNLCQSANLFHETKRGDVSDQLCNDFLMFLIDMAIKAKTSHVILLVDEMQRLTLKQFYAFAELHDSLRLKKIMLTVIFIGNRQESNHLLDKIEESEFKHVRERFFSQRVIFNSLTSKDDVIFCLKQYDSLRFPSKSGPTYTECFLPKPYSSGFRLAQCAEMVWKTLNEQKPLLGKESISMQLFISLVNVLLVDFLPANGTEKFGRQMVIKALEAAGVTPSERFR